MDIECLSGKEIYYSTINIFLRNYFIWVQSKHFLFSIHTWLKVIWSLYDYSSNKTNVISTAISLTLKLLQYKF